MRTSEGQPARLADAEVVGDRQVVKQEEGRRPDPEDSAEEDQPDDPEARSAADADRGVVDEDQDDEVGERRRDQLHHEDKAVGRRADPHLAPAPGHRDHAGVEPGEHERDAGGEEAAETRGA